MRLKHTSALWINRVRNRRSFRSKHRLPGGIKVGLRGRPCIDSHGLPYDGAPHLLYLCSLRGSRYTGKERDVESGLDYFKYRMYASNMGRWMSPDPSGLTHADLGNPQSLNLYNYVGNNPLSRTDLDGLCWEGLQWACNAAQALNNGVHGLGFQTNTSVNREQHNANQLLHHDGVQTEGLSRRQIRKHTDSTWRWAR